MSQDQGANQADGQSDVVGNGQKHPRRKLVSPIVALLLLQMTGLIGLGCYVLFLQSKIDMIEHSKIRAIETSLMGTPYRDFYSVLEARFWAEARSRRGMPRPADENASYEFFIANLTDPNFGGNGNIPLEFSPLVDRFASPEERERLHKDAPPIELSTFPTIAQQVNRALVAADVALSEARLAKNDLGIREAGNKGAIDALEMQLRTMRSDLELELRLMRIDVDDLKKWRTLH